jgi:SWI2/SNF2 ATPase
MKGFKDQSIQEMQILFTTLRNSIPDGEPLSQEILSQCAELGAHVLVSGQKPWRFQVIYHLDDQIYKTFQDVGAVTERQVQAESGEHLQQLLREDHRNIFTLIQKFHIEKGQTYPQLSDRADIIVITDEAHRTQYDTLALNPRQSRLF